MAGRYLISGTQIGVLRGLLDASDCKEQIKKQLDEIYKSQFIGNSENPLKVDVAKLTADFRGEQ